MSATVSVELDPSSLAQIHTWTALGGGAVLLVAGAARRSFPGLCLTLAAAPLVYRGLTGRWPAFFTRHAASTDTRIALSDDRGVHVRESIRIEKPIEEVFQFWRRLENLPKFMAHLERVTETDGGRSRWVARGPAGIRLEWDAEIINEVENQVIGWRSLADADLVSAGSVNFDRARGGRSTQVTVHLQYAPPAGRVGAAVATLFGRAPARTIREDLRRLKHLLEAGELAQSAASPAASR
jgi:uncharacterized membrane protein